MVGLTVVRVAPPAEYPVPLVSLDVVYAVVEAPRLAEFVYKAILNVSDVKSCIALRISSLKLVHIPVVIAILKSHHTIVMSPTMLP